MVTRYIVLLLLAAACHAQAQGHRRARHLNPSAAGAAVALDARFLSGFSDADTVTTWTSRTGTNSPTQGTAADRPVYKTAIVGGCPVLRFDGTSDNLQSAAFANGTAASAIMVASATNWTGAGQYRPICGHGYINTNNTTLGIALAVLTPGSSQDWLANDIVAFGSGFPSTRTPRAIGPASAGSNARIISTVLGSTLARIFNNGATLSSRVETTGTSAAFTRSFNVGASPGNTGEFWAGDIALVIYWTSEISTPLRRRFEQAAAYAFKLSCS